MLVYAEVHVEGALNVRHISRHLQDQAVRRSILDGQPIGLGEVDQCVILRLRGPKLRGELVHREELMVQRARWIVEIADELIEFDLIA